MVVVVFALGVTAALVVVRRRLDVAPAVVRRFRFVVGGGGCGAGDGAGLTEAVLGERQLRHTLPEPEESSPSPHQA